MKVATSISLELPLMKTLNEISVKTKNGVKSKVIEEALLSYIHNHVEFESILEKHQKEENEVIA